MFFEASVHTLGILLTLQIMPPVTGKLADANDQCIGRDGTNQAVLKERLLPQSFQRREA